MSGSERLNVGRFLPPCDWWAVRVGAVYPATPGLLLCDWLLLLDPLDCWLEDRAGLRVVEDRAGLRVLEDWAELRELEAGLLPMVAGDVCELNSSGDWRVGLSISDWTALNIGFWAIQAAVGHSEAWSMLPAPSPPIIRELRPHHWDRA